MGKIYHLFTFLKQIKCWYEQYILKIIIWVLEWETMPQNAVVQDTVRNDISQEIKSYTFVYITCQLKWFYYFIASSVWFWNFTSIIWYGNLEFHSRDEDKLYNLSDSIMIFRCNTHGLLQILKILQFV